MNENILPKGKHRARARDWSIGEAGTGTKQIGVDFDLLDRPGECQPWYGYFTEKALDSTMKALRAMGWTGYDLSELADRGGGLDTNEVILVVDHESETDRSGQPMVDDQGEVLMRARTRWVNPVGWVAMKKTLEGGDLRSFAAEMKARILQLDPAAAKRAVAPARGSVASRPVAPQQPRGEEPPTDDGIPF